MSDNKFPEGISVFKPSDKAPDFVIADVVVSFDEFGKWLKQNKDDQGKVRLQVLRSKNDGSKYYFTKNDFVPQTKSQPRKKQAEGFDDDVDDLGF